MMAEGGDPANRVNAAAHLRNWNPMEDEYRSILNFGFSANYVPNALAIGGIAAEGDYASIGQVICPFHDGRGSCFKGRHCVRHHPIGPEPTGPAISSVTGLSVNKLPKKFEPGPHPDIMFLAKICYINSPLDFYLIPSDSFACLCGCGSRPAVFEGCTTQLRGKDGAKFLDQDFYRYMKAKKRSLQLPAYKKGQLVAAKAMVDLINIDNPGEKLQWFRGVVQEDCHCTRNVHALPDVKVKLIDFGAKISVPFHRVSALPKLFANMAPLGYRCQLANFMSVGPTFSSAAIRRFKSIVRNQELVVLFKSCVPDESVGDKPIKGKEFDPSYIYSVELTTLVKNERVAEVLANEGLGLMLHPFPLRPGIMKNYDLSISAAKLLEPEKGMVVPALDSFATTMDKEKKRLFDMIVRKDGYFSAPIERFDPNMTMHLKFPKEWATEGVPDVPKLEREFPKRTMPIGKVKFAPPDCGNEAPNDDESPDEGSTQITFNRYCLDCSDISDDEPENMDPYEQYGRRRLRETNLLCCRLKKPPF